MLGLLRADMPELRVLDYAQALQRVQNMESRGDLQNKGIYKFLMTVYDWTERFPTNKSLPTLENLEKELGLEQEKLNYFVQEYAIRSDPPLVRKLNYIDYHPEGVGDPSKPSSHLKHYTVFCRPTSADGMSCIRYVIGLNDISFNAIQRWIQEKRVLAPRETRKEEIFRAIESNSLVDTYASSEIANLFQCPFDKRKYLRDITLTIHIKPILKRLVDEKLVYFVRNEKASQPGNKSVFYYFNKEEIFDRLEIYMEFVKEKIVPEFVRMGVLNQPDEEDYFERKSLAETLLTFMNESFGDQKTVIEELILLNDFYSEEIKKVEEENKRKHLTSLLDYVQSSGRILNLHQIRIDNQELTEEERNFLLTNSNILYAEYADKKNYYEYILHKQNIQTAVEQAIENYKKTGNNLELIILRLMGVVDEIQDFGLVRIFEETECHSLFNFLPFFTWLWRWLLGNRVVHKFEAEEIRKKLRQGINQKISEKKPQFLARLKQLTEQRKQENQELNSSQIKSKLVKQGSSTTATQKPEWDEELKGKNESQPLTPEQKQTLDRIIKILEEAWDFGVFPDRVYLREQLSEEISEEELVQFIKKNAGKEIFSFMVRNQFEKYPFPILIPRKYIIKNGKKMIAQAEKIIQEQKNASIPNQMEYDKAISLVEFLERILSKLRTS